MVRNFPKNPSCVKYLVPLLLMVLITPLMSAYGEDKFSIQVQLKEKHSILLD